MKMLYVLSNLLLFIFFLSVQVLGSGYLSVYWTFGIYLFLCFISSLILDHAFYFLLTSHV